MTRLCVEDEGGGCIQAFELPVSGKTTELSLTTTPATTAAMEVGMYRFLSDMDCIIAMGESVSADDMKLVSEQPEYFHLTSAKKVSARSIVGIATLKMTLC